MKFEDRLWILQKEILAHFIIQLSRLIKQIPSSRSLLKNQIYYDCMHIFAAAQSHFLKHHAGHLPTFLLSQLTTILLAIRIARFVQTVCCVNHRKCQCGNTSLHIGTMPTIQSRWQLYNLQTKKTQLVPYFCSIFASGVSAACCQMLIFFCVVWFDPILTTMGPSAFRNHRYKLPLPFLHRHSTHRLWYSVLHEEGVPSHDFLRDYRDVVQLRFVTGLLVVSHEQPRGVTRANASKG
ncbi:unnamed protein product [Albugo candida]|uniref:Uncharacterized protein n=1 Tax=Albugo candida TaxID=65357 RepID=A0A024GRA3_9STRA|nr:unnamed protein product [Albugo candida]|eukprot:CCI49319.1 unnamed protein product [Albugo candida]